MMEDSSVILYHPKKTCHVFVILMILKYNLESGSPRVNLTHFCLDPDAFLSRFSGVNLPHFCLDPDTSRFKIMISV